MKSAHYATTRRRFTCMLGAAALARAATTRKLKIGHTGITWNNNIEQAVTDIADLGFWGFETFGNVIETWEKQGGLKTLLDAHKLPLVSAYCGFNMTDPTKRKDELAKMKGWGELLLKNGGNVSVLGPNNVQRATYDFKMYKTNIVDALNECSKMLTDMGIVPVLHQHTGTCVEARDEVYAVLDAVDSKYVKFGPDIGQLQKGGVDPVKVVSDYLPLVRHMHLKDFNGGDAYLGYCPLGGGKVDIPAILDLAEKADMQGKVMVELDSSRGMPIAAGDTAKIAKAYLQKQGCEFRS